MLELAKRMALYSLKTWAVNFYAGASIASLYAFSNGADPKEQFEDFCLMMAIFPVVIAVALALTFLDFWWLFRCRNRGFSRYILSLNGQKFLLDMPTEIDRLPKSEQLKVCKAQVRGQCHRTCDRVS